MLNTTPLGEPLAVTMELGVDVPSPQLIVTEPVPVVKSATVARGLASVTVATSRSVNGTPSMASTVPPCEARGASTTLTLRSRTVGAAAALSTSVIVAVGVTS